MLFPFSFNGKRCQVVTFQGGTQVRIRFADVTPQQVSEGTHEALVSCLSLKTWEPTRDARDRMAEIVTQKYGSAEEYLRVVAEAFAP